MKPKNTPTFTFRSEEVFNSIVSFEEDKVLLKDVAPKEVAILFYMIEPEDIRIVYEMTDPVCNCGNKLHKHEIIDWEMDKKYSIYKYRYKCPKCGKTIITPLPEIVDKGCCYTNEFKEIITNLYSKEHVAYSNATKFINEKYDLNMSRQTVYNYNDTESDEYLTQKETIIEEKLEENNIELTGYPGHDEAFFKINGEKYSLLAMVDSNNQRIINDQIVLEDEYRDLLEAFIIYSQKNLSVYQDPNTPNPRHPLLLQDLKKHTLIGDGLAEYPAIAKKANMDFHPCVFHKIMNQRLPTWNTQRSIERKIQSNKNKIEKNKEQINKYYKKYSGQGKIKKTDKKRRKHKDRTTQRERENIRLNKDNKDLKKTYDEFDDLSERISEIFKQDTIKDAKRRFNILYNQIEHIPEEVAKFLRNLKKDLDATLSYIENENIPKTNNWLELFFKIVFPKRYRNRFKTTKGVKRFLRSGKIKWYENVVLHEEIKIEKKSTWTKLKEYANEINQQIMTQIHKNLGG